MGDPDRTVCRREANRAAFEQSSGSGLKPVCLKFTNSVGNDMHRSFVDLSSINTRFASETHFRSGPMTKYLQHPFRRMPVASLPKSLDSRQLPNQVTMDLGHLLFRGG